MLSNRRTSGRHRSRTEIANTKGPLPAQPDVSTPRRLASARNWTLQLLDQMPWGYL
jgi:hypothetical protein